MHFPHSAPPGKAIVLLNTTMVIGLCGWVGSQHAVLFSSENLSTHASSLPMNALRSEQNNAINTNG